MKRSGRLPRIAILLPCIFATNTLATEYKAVLLPASEYSDAAASGLSNSFVVGEATPPGNNFPHAILWNRTSNTLTDLNPAGYRLSRAMAASDNVQVGYGEGASINYYDHALLWTGTAESAIDLHPAGFNFSYLYDATDTYQVGFASVGPPGPDKQALMWRGTADSAVMLPTPSGYWSTGAVAASGDSQVGGGLTTITGTYGYHALLWHGPTANAVDLNPLGWSSSYAVDVWGNTQVGYGTPNDVNAPYMGHALLWNSTAASVVDLHPAAFYMSQANAVYDGIQVGSASISSIGPPHAFAWHGTADSAIDLHQYLAALGPDFVGSGASSVEKDGTIVGTAFDSQRSYAVIWTPYVPEPNSAVLLFSIFTLCLFVRVRHRISPPLRLRAFA